MTEGQPQYNPNKHKSARVLLASVLLAGGLAGCQSKFQGGENGVASRDIKVTVNNNALNIEKEHCTIDKDDPFSIGSFSTLRTGANEREPIVELISHDCTGWAINDSSLNDIIK